MSVTTTQALSIQLRHTLLCNIVQSFSDTFSQTNALWSLRQMEQELYDMYHENQDLYLIRLERFVHMFVAGLNPDKLSLFCKKYITEPEEKTDKLKTPSTPSVNGACFLKCSKCKSTDIIWNARQTRSGDEGMTIFCTCSGCETRWRM